MGNVGSIFEKSNDQQGQQWQNMIGKTVAHYRITEKLGAGGMGEVYAAEDTRLGRTVALKFLPEESGKDRQLLERFLREARAASSLNHPNICTIHDIGEHEGRQYIVMERLEGRTIASIIASSPMPLGQMLDASIQIADALDATHSRGIIHRDIKPANLFITKRGHVKVLDFGLAKLTEPDAESQPPSDPDATLVRKIELTRTGAALGTVSYMSPEQARGEKLDHRSDIFSLGAVLYEMATGRDAFAGSSNAITFDNILNRQPPSPTRVNVDLPDDLDLIIARCLEKDPELRYQSAGDLRAALKRLRRDTGLSSSAEPLLTQTSDTPAPMPKPRSSGDPTASSSAFASEIIHHHKTGLLMSLAAIVVVIVGLAWLLAPYLTSTPITSSPGTPEAVGPGIDANEAAADSDRTNDLTQPPGDGKPRLAVLPFEIIGAAPDAEYLADEIPASIIDSMATLSGLTVVPRSSSFRHRDSPKDNTEIGEDLGADYVLSGQIMARSGSMRVRAELIDVATDTQQWGKRFDLPLDNTLEVETEISRGIAEALRVQITGEEQAALDRRRPVNAEAHAACLEGRFWWNKRSAEGLLRAIDLYKKAVRLDPDYALAHTGMGEVYLMMGIYSHRPKEVMPQAHVALNRAIEIDDGLPEPHAGLGFYYNVYAWDWDTSEAYFKHALQLDSDNAMAQVWYSVLLRFQARWDDAQTHLDRAVALEPGAGFIRHEAVLPMFDQRDFARAAPFFKQVTEMHPEYKTALGSLGSAYFYLGRHDEAFELLQHYVTSEEASSYQLGWYGYFLGLAGRRAEALKELNRLEELASRRYVPAYAFAQVYAGLGDADRLFEMFNRAIDERFLRVLMLRILDFFDPYRQDPRYPELLRRIGLPLEPIDLPDLGIETPRPSVAVLPFEMTTADADAAYLADEIPASVIDALSNISFLHVIPRSSSFRLRGSTDTIPEIGKALDADFVLTGQIVPRDGDLRIRAELVAIDTNRQLFGDRLDRSTDDTLLVETEITDRIIETLKLPVTDEETQKLRRRRPVNTEAHAAYLEGHFWWNKRTPKGLDRAIELYDKAIEIDPQYALAHAGLAETYVLMGTYSGRAHDSMPEALASAERAIELDSMLAAPHAVLGQYHSLYSWDWAAAEVAYARSIELDPDYATALMWFAECLIFLGRMDEAQTLYDRAVKLEPSSMIIQLSAGIPALLKRQFIEAQLRFEAVLAMDPNFLVTNLFLGETLLGQGRFDEAIQQYRLAILREDAGAYFLGALGRAYGLAGRREEALQELQRLTKLSETRIVPHSALAEVYFGLGDLDQAFALLDLAADEREFSIVLMKFDPTFDAARHDPRFDALLDRIGFPANPPAPVIERIEIPRPSVAVLPFEMTRADEDADYLADEIPASVIDSLSNISFVHVIPRSSSFRHRDSTDTIQQIGQALGADFVLTGQIIPRGNELRIRAELVSVRTNRQLFSERLDRSVSNTLALEIDFTEQIVETLQLPVTRDESQQLAKRRPVNPEAHAAYLQGRFQWNKRTKESILLGLKYFEQAAALDPTYARAYAGIADSHYIMTNHGFVTSDVALPKIHAALDKALQLDPNLAEVHITKGSILTDYDYDHEGAEREFKLGLSLEPEYATGHQWYGSFLHSLGRIEEGLAHLELARELDPYSAVISHTVAMAYRSLGRIEDAIAADWTAIELNDFKWAKTVLIEIHLNTNRVDELYETLAKFGESSALIAEAKAAFENEGIYGLGRVALRSHFLNEDGTPRYHSPALLAIYESLSGNKVRAIELLEQAYTQHDGLLMAASIHTNPSLALVRDDPRCQKILHNINIID